MAFGPIMQLAVGEIQVELAPLNREVMNDFIDPGMQQASVMKYMRSGAQVLEDELEWYDKVRKATDQIVWGIWAIEEGERKLIGSTGLSSITRDTFSQATSGSMLFRKEYWGKGIASAIHKARTWYAFEQLGLARIKSEVIQGNVASRRALENAGYSLAYVERNEHFVDGRMRHTDKLECLNPSYDAWKRWWGEDRPTKSAVEARKRARAAMEWVSENVTLP